MQEQQFKTSISKQHQQQHKRKQKKTNNKQEKNKPIKKTRTIQLKRHI